MALSRTWSYYNQVENPTRVMIRLEHPEPGLAESHLDRAGRCQEWIGSHQRLRQTVGEDCDDRLQYQLCPGIPL